MAREFAGARLAIHPDVGIRRKVAAATVLEREHIPPGRPHCGLTTVVAAAEGLTRFPGLWAHLGTMGRRGRPQRAASGQRPQPKKDGALASAASARHHGSPSLPLEQAPRVLTLEHARPSARDRADDCEHGQEDQAQAEGASGRSPRRTSPASVPSPRFFSHSCPFATVSAATIPRWRTTERRPILEYSMLSRSPFFSGSYA